jgi:hypothetical protein
MKEPVSALFFTWDFPQFNLANRALNLMTQRKRLKCAISNGAKDWGGLNSDLWISL